MITLRTSRPGSAALIDQSLAPYFEVYMRAGVTYGWNASSTLTVDSSTVTADGGGSTAKGDQLLYAIDWTAWLENPWIADYAFALNACVRPSIPNGLEYLCTSAGQSGSAEPTWPGAPGGTVQDGTVTWTAQATSTASLSSTLASANWLAPAPITCSAPSTNGQRALATINSSAGTPGSDYVVLCTATFADSEFKTATLKVKVR